MEGTAPVSDAEGMSTAVIKVEGETKIAFVGSEFLDGKAKIADIQPRFIVVKEGSDFKVIKLWTEKAKTAVFAFSVHSLMTLKSLPSFTTMKRG